MTLAAYLSDRQECAFSIHVHHTRLPTNTQQRPLLRLLLLLGAGCLLLLGTEPLLLLLLLWRL
jgi:hypothetical protein